MFLYVRHPCDPTRLAGVMDEMQKLGSPRIQCVEVPGGWLAIEGRHRLSAAWRMGLPVVILPVVREQFTDDVSVYFFHRPALPSHRYTLLPKGFLALYEYRGAPENSLLTGGQKID